MQPTSSVFGTNTGHAPIRKDVLETEPLGGIQANIQPGLKNETSEKGFAVGIITLHVSMEDSKVIVAIGVVPASPVPVLLGTSFVFRIVNVIFRSEQKIVSNSSKPLATQAITDTPEELKNKS